MAAGAAAATAIVTEKLQNLRSTSEYTACPPLRKHLNDAEKKLSLIYQFLSDNSGRLKQQEWLGRLLRTLYDAEEFIDLFYLKVARRQNETFHVIPKTLVSMVWKVSLCNRMAKFVENIRVLLQEQHLKDIESDHTVNKEKTETVAADRSGEGRIRNWRCDRRVRLDSFSNYQEHIDVFARREKIKNLVDEPQQTDEPWQELVPTIILGEEGSGKTFLGRAIYNRPEYKGGLYLRAWVHMSDDMDYKHLLFEILKQLKNNISKPEQHLDIREIELKLIKKLPTKRFLIVLDGASEIKLLYSFLGSLPFFVKSGSQVIITTRSEKIACNQGIELIKLRKLDYQESWSFLNSKLEKPHSGPAADFEEHVKQKIIQICDGSPLKISLWIGLLSTITDPEKRKALVDNKALPPIILDLSYDSLPLEQKPCFLYMALFPKAFPIPLRRLVRLWSAEGLLNFHFDEERKNDGMTPEDLGKMYILDLLRRNLIEVTSWKADGTPKTCQMLTSLYDKACRMAIKAGLLHIHDKKEEQKDLDRDRNQQSSKVQIEQYRVRWLAEHTNVVRRSNSSYLHIHHVRSFLSFYTRRGILTKDIGTFLRKVTSQNEYGLLRVLDLEGVFKPNLQDVLKKLVLLKYLGLRSTVLDSIPDTIVQLPYLETLDVKHTNITRLPSSFWKARILRHLHLNWFYFNLESIFNTCRDNPGALSNLQTLTGLVGCDVKNLMSDHLDYLTTLTDLELHLQCTNGESENRGIVKWIENLTNLQSLKLGTIKDAQPYSLPSLSLSKHRNLSTLYLLGKLPQTIDWYKLLPQNSVRVLTLSGSNVGEKCIRPLSQLQNLRTLRLLANSFTDEILKFTEGFTNLKVLEMWMLSKLKKVFIGDKAMPHLQEVEFRFLESLEEVIGIEKCPALKNVRVVYEEDHGFVKRIEETLTERKKSMLNEKKSSKSKERVLVITLRSDEQNNKNLRN